MGREEDRRRGADVSFSGEQHAHALVVGRGDALHSMEIIESGGGLCVLAAMIQSPLPWVGPVEKKFASTKLYVLVGFFTLALNKSSLATEER